MVNTDPDTVSAVQYSGTKSESGQYLILVPMQFMMTITIEITLKLKQQTNKFRIHQHI
jgi:hypothetical protein